MGPIRRAGAWGTLSALMRYAEWSNWGLTALKGCHVYSHWSTLSAYMGTLSTLTGLSECSRKGSLSTRTGALGAFASRARVWPCLQEVGGGRGAAVRACVRAYECAL